MPYSKQQSNRSKQASKPARQPGKFDHVKPNDLGILYPEIERLMYALVFGEVRGCGMGSDGPIRTVSEIVGQATESKGYVVIGAYEPAFDEVSLTRHQISALAAAGADYRKILHIVLGAEWGDGTGWLLGEPVDLKRMTPAGEVTYRVQIQPLVVDVALLYAAVHEYIRSR